MYTKFWFIVSGLSISNVTMLLIVINKHEKRKIILSCNIICLMFYVNYLYNTATRLSYSCFTKPTNSNF